MADKSIRAQSTQVAEMSADWEMIDALMDGTPAMRKGAKKWLPQFPAEPDDCYNERLKTAVLHPVFKRTVLVNAARPFSRPMVVNDEATAKVRNWLDDIDLQGTSLAAICVQIMGCCLSSGLSGVLVDYPKADAIKTVADEKAAGVRPYWVRYPPGHILGWKTRVIDGQLQLTQLRLLEMVDIDDGAFGIKTIEQVRVCEPGKWTTYRLNPRNPEVWDEFESGPTTLKVVPFVFFYGVRKAFGVGISPLKDLAYQNVEHWQSASDQQTILHVARVPVLFAKKFGDTSIRVGAGAAVNCDADDCDLKYVEHSGAAIEAGKDSLIDLQDRMRSAGAELISLLPAYTTATQVSSDSEATKSLLQQIVEIFEESVQACIDLMGAWVGESTPSEVEIYKDFGIATDNDPAALSAAVKTGAISSQTHFEELQRRDILSADRTWDDEAKRVARDRTLETKRKQALSKPPKEKP